MTLMDEKEREKFGPEDVSLTFTYEYGPAFLQGRKPTNDELLVLLNSQAKIYTKGTFLHAFYDHQSEHLRERLKISKIGDQLAELRPFVVSYGQCGVRCRPKSIPCVPDYNQSWCDAC